MTDISDAEMLWRARATEAEARLKTMHEDLATRLETTFEVMLRSGDALTEDQKMVLRRFLP